MYGYIYKTTFIVTNKIYIGQKKSTKFIESYKGSGVIIKNLLSSYSDDKFITVLIDVAENQEELDSKEIYWIDYYNATDANIGYNISLGGRGVNFEHHTEEAKQKISEANKGKTRTVAVRNKMSDDRKGSKWINNGIENKLIRSYQIDSYIYEGSVWKFGMLPGRVNGSMSEDRRQKISKSNRGKKHDIKHVEAHRLSLLSQKRHWYTNGSDNISLCEGDEIPDGYYRGRYFDDEFKRKCGEKNIGKIPWNKNKSYK